jgi:predicted DsbA family dithiol-disulfide isomerase
LTQINAAGPASGHRLGEMLQNTARTDPADQHAISVAEITYFSDALCVWAYISQARIDAIKRKFGDAVHIEQRFCSVFGDTATKIATTWKDKGAHQGFNAHLRKVAAGFPHIKVHPEVWLRTRPLSSTSPHLFLKAVQDLERVSTGETAPGTFEQVMWALRCAFFRDCRDIARWEVQCEIASGLGVDIGAVEQRIRSGAAFARLAADYQAAERMRIEGSPSLVLNEGRQKLYGNVGFRLMEANIQEFMRTPRADEASWC